MATQIGFFFKSFDIQSVRLGVVFPIDVSGRIAGIETFVFCKFSRKSPERTFVYAADKTFHDLIGQELEVSESGGLLDGFF
jgi:hypothetical protein